MIQEQELPLERVPRRELVLVRDDDRQLPDQLSRHETRRRDEIRRRRRR